jgi:ABC-type uncharacterized transport system ATPase subunit
MIHLIVGTKGKGKTKILLERVNEEVKTAEGNIVFLDKDSKNMYDLNNRIRLVSLADYGIGNRDALIGFIYGILSQDHDLEKIYFDNFQTLANVSAAELPELLETLETIGQNFKVDLILTASVEKSELPERWQALAVEAV